MFITCQFPAFIRWGMNNGVPAHKIREELTHKENEGELKKNKNSLSYALIQRWKRKAPLDGFVGAGRKRDGGKMKKTGWRGAEMNEGHGPRCSDKLFTSFFSTVPPAAFHWACQVPTQDAMGGDVSLEPGAEEKKECWRHKMCCTSYSKTCD